MDNATLVANLIALADVLDSPDGPGSGAVALDAATVIERLTHYDPGGS